MCKLFTFQKGCLVSALFFSLHSFSQNVVTVTDCNLNGWVKQIIQAGATVAFKNAPPDPILGKGSVEVFTPQNFVRLRNTAYQHSLLSSFTEFSYSVFIQQRSQDDDVPSVILQIDLNGDETFDQVIVFSPEFQTGQHAIDGGVPDQGVSKTNTWQTWDAFHGAWWIGPAPDPNNGGILFSLPSYINDHPTARIVNAGAMGTGGIRLTIGGPAEVFGPNQKVNIDNVRIGTNAGTTIYDFEFTTANAGEDRNVIYGYGSNCTTLIGTASGGVPDYTYSWSPGGSTPGNSSTEVCPTVTTTYTLSVTDHNGCTHTDDVTVYVNDVRCGSTLDKVKLCHHGEEICVAKESVRAHLNHGDELGSCPVELTKGNKGPGKQLPEQPGHFKLSNFPNPFSGTTQLSIDVPFDGKLNVKLYDLTGKEIATFINANKKRGHYVFELPSSGLTTGVYYCYVTLTSGKKIVTQTTKIIVAY